jgi:hypothetical protein
MHLICRVLWLFVNPILKLLEPCIRPTSHDTVGNILQRHNIPPAPVRETSPSWRHLMTHYKNQLLACDFFTVETLLASRRPTGLDRPCIRVCHDHLGAEHS